MKILQNIDFQNCDNAVQDSTIQEPMPAYGDDRISKSTVTYPVLQNEGHVTVLIQYNLPNSTQHSAFSLAEVCWGCVRQ